MALETPLMSQRPRRWDARVSRAWRSWRISKCRWCARFTGPVRVAAPRWRWPATGGSRATRARRSSGCRRTAPEQFPAGAASSSRAAAAARFGAAAALEVILKATLLPAAECATGRDRGRSRPGGRAQGTRQGRRAPAGEGWAAVLRDATRGGRGAFRGATRGDAQENPRPRTGAAEGHRPDRAVGRADGRGGARGRSKVDLER